MKLSRILVSTVLGLSSSLVWVAPASAEETPVDAIHQFFVSRDQAWFGGVRAAESVSYRNSAAVDAAARTHLDQWRDIADSTRAELGLVAEDVDTFTSSTSGGSACGTTKPFEPKWSFRTTAVTSLDWNAAGLGESSIADDYLVCVRAMKNPPKPPSGRAASQYQVSAVRIATPPYSEPDIPDAVATPQELGVKPASTDRAAAKRLAGGSRPPAPAADVGAADVYRYDAAAAARYALYWSETKTYNGDRIPSYNPEYPRLDNDCTNFVSQALRAGGWHLRGGYDPDAPLNWTPDLNGPRGPSKSWSRAAWLFDFAVQHTDRAIAWGTANPDNDWNNIWNLIPGDVVFIDWASDNAIDHALIVVGRDTVAGFTEPTISQHSSHRHNLPMSIYIKMAAMDNANMTFYPVLPLGSYVE